MSRKANVWKFNPRSRRPADCGSTSDPSLETVCEQCRQAGQGAIDLEELAIDHAFDDQRGVLERCVRGVERGLPRAFKQYPRATDQAQHNQTEPENDRPAEGAPTRHARGSLKPVASGQSDRPIRPSVPFESMR